MNGPNANAPGSARLVRCPHCGGKAVYGPENPVRPFCSPRCRVADLGAWADEAYRVADGTTLAFDPPVAGAPATLGQSQVADFRRWLDLDTAVAVTEYRCDGVTFRREAFASAVPR